MESLLNIIMLTLAVTGLFTIVLLGIAIVYLCIEFLKD